MPQVDSDPHGGGYLCLDSQTTMGVFFTADTGRRLRAMQTYKGQGE